MKYIKYTFLIIIIFAVIFLGLEVKTARDQGRAIAMAEELATYGPQGNPEKRELPSDWNISIAGAIGSGSIYEIHSSYSATANKRNCKSWNPFSNSLIPDSKTFKYYPEIQNGHHNLTIPLVMLNPDAECKFKIDDINICFGYNDKKAFSGCQSLFVKQIPSGSKYRKIINDTINIECVSPGPDDGFSTCGQQPIDQGIAIAQYFPGTSEEYIVNINVIHPDQYKIDLLFGSKFYNRRVEYLQNKYAESTTEIIDLNPEELEVELRDQHKLLIKLLEEAYKENELLLKLVKACSDCNLNSSIEKIIFHRLNTFTNDIKSAQKIRAIEVKLINDQDLTARDSSLSTAKFNDVFSYDPYYLQQIKFLFLKNISAENGHEMAEILESDLRHDIAELPDKLKQDVTIYYGLVRQMKACKSCEDSMIKSTETIIKKLSKAAGSYLTSKGSVIDNIRRLQTELLINN